METRWIIIAKAILTTWVLSQSLADQSIANTLEGKCSDLGKILCNLEGPRRQIEAGLAPTRANSLKCTVPVLWELEFIGLNLQFCARYPARSDGEIITGSEQILPMADVFKPCAS